MYFLVNMLHFPSSHACLPDGIWYLSKTCRRLRFFGYLHARWFACCTLHRAEGWYVGIPCTDVFSRGAIHTAWRVGFSYWEKAFRGRFTTKMSLKSMSKMFLPWNFLTFSTTFVCASGCKLPPSCWLVSTRIIIPSQSLTCKPENGTKRIGDSFWKPSFLLRKLTCPLKINGWKMYILLK